MAKRKSTLTAEDLRIGPGKSNLSSLFAAGTSRDTIMQHPIMVEIKNLLDNPYQPRLEDNETSLDELAEVIRQQGFQGVLVARRRHGLGDAYELTAGHRRREAARRAGLRVLPIVVQELTDEEMVVRAITENIQREDLSPLEEGRIYLVMQQEMSYSYRQIAREVGKKLGYVQNRIRVAQAPSDVQAMVRARPETLHAVRYLVDIESETLRAEVIAQLLTGALTNDDLRSYVELLKSAPALTLPLQPQASLGEQGHLPAQITSVPQAPNSEDDLFGDKRPSSAGGEALDGYMSPEIPDTLSEPAGPPDTGPLLIPKRDGSGGFLVMPSERAKRFPHLLSTAHVDAGESGGLSSAPRSGALQAPIGSLPVPFEKVKEVPLPEMGAGTSAISDRQGGSGVRDASGSPDFGVPRETEGLSVFRLRRSKLATALRALRAYRGILTGDEPLTKEERDYLQEIVSLAGKALDLKPT